MERTLIELIKLERINDITIVNVINAINSINEKYSFAKSLFKSDFSLVEFVDKLKDEESYYIQDTINWNKINSILNLKGDNVLTTLISQSDLTWDEKDEIFLNVPAPTKLVKLKNGIICKQRFSNAEEWEVKPFTNSVYDDLKNTYINSLITRSFSYSDKELCRKIIATKLYMMEGMT